MMGVESRNENRAAVGRSRLRNKPAEMVMPLRETPGMMASACAVPISIASAIETCADILLLAAERIGEPHHQADHDRGRSR